MPLSPTFTVTKLCSLLQGPFVAHVTQGKSKKKVYIVSIQEGDAAFTLLTFRFGLWTKSPHRLAHGPAERRKDI